MVQTKSNTVELDIASENSKVSNEARQPEKISARKPRLFSRLASNRWAAGLAVFALALSLRVWHNSSLEHRVWFCQDAQNYLRSGNSILYGLKKSGGPTGFFDYALKDAQQYSGVFNAATSTKLVDRLMTDGPVFPAYLASME